MSAFHQNRHYANCCAQRSERCRFERQLAGRYAPVYGAAHSVKPAGVRCLPHGPRSCTEAGRRADAAKPERTVEGRADPITLVEPLREIKNGTLPVARFYDPQEIAEFFVDCRPRRAAAAVTGKFEVYCWRKCGRVERHSTHEIRCLCSPAPAEPEKMVGASVDARAMGAAP